MNGKNIADIPAAVYIIMFASVTGWSKEAIENLSQGEFLMYSSMVELVFKNQSAKL